MRKSLFSLIVVLSICGAAVAAQTGVFEAPSYRLPGEFDRDAFGAEQQRLLTRLVAEQVEEGLATPVTIKLTEQEMLEKLQQLPFGTWFEFQGKNNEIRRLKRRKQ